MPIERTAAHQLADQLLGGEGKLEEFVRTRRVAGKAWRVVSRELFAACQVDVTHETLRAWFADEVDA